MVNIKALDSDWTMITLHNLEIHEIIQYINHIIDKIDSTIIYNLSMKTIVS